MYRCSNTTQCSNLHAKFACKINLVSDAHLWTKKILALLKAVALFTSKRRRCKPTRIHCVVCVITPHDPTVYTVTSLNTCRTTTLHKSPALVPPIRMRRPYCMRLVYGGGGVVSCDVVTGTHILRTVCSGGLLQHWSFFGVNNSTALIGVLAIKMM